MTNWTEVNCRIDCGRCNHKGVPSASKGSKYCRTARKEIVSDKESDGIFAMVRSMFNIKGKMRAFGRIKTKEVDKDE